MEPGRCAETFPNLFAAGKISFDELIDTAVRTPKNRPNEKTSLVAGNIFLEVDEGARGKP